MTRSRTNTQSTSKKHYLEHNKKTPKAMHLEKTPTGWCFFQSRFRWKKTPVAQEENTQSVFKSPSPIILVSSCTVRAQEHRGYLLDSSSFFLESNNPRLLLAHKRHWGHQ